MRFDDGGMQIAAGTSNGLVAIFDLRSQKPLVVKDHMYGSNIVDIKFHTDAGGRRRVISADSHIVKVGSCFLFPGKLLNCIVLRITAYVSRILYSFRKCIAYVSTKMHCVRFNMASHRTEPPPLPTPT